jgi:hypothetical protein
MIEPQKHSEYEQQLRDSASPGAVSYADAIRMRITMIAGIGLIIYIFFQVIL